MAIKTISYDKAVLEYNTYNSQVSMYIKMLDYELSNKTKGLLASNIINKIESMSSNIIAALKQITGTIQSKLNRAKFLTKISDAYLLSKDITNDFKIWIRLNLEIKQISSIKLSVNADSQSIINNDLTSNEIDSINVNKSIAILKDVIHKSQLKLQKAVVDSNSIFVKFIDDVDNKANSLSNEDQNIMKLAVNKVIYNLINNGTSLSNNNESVVIDPILLTSYKIGSYIKEGCSKLNNAIIHIFGPLGEILIVADFFNIIIRGKSFILSFILEVINVLLHSEIIQRFFKIIGAMGVAFIFIIGVFFTLCTCYVFYNKVNVMDDEKKMKDVNNKINKVNDKSVNNTSNTNISTTNTNSNNDDNVFSGFGNTLGSK